MQTNPSKLSKVSKGSLAAEPQALTSVEVCIRPYTCGRGEWHTNLSTLSKVSKGSLAADPQALKSTEV